MRDQEIMFHPCRFRFFLFLFFTLVYFSVQEVSAQTVVEINSYIETNAIQPSDPFMDLRYGNGGIIEITGGKPVFPKSANAKNLIVNSSELKWLPSDPGKFGGVQFMQINLVAGQTLSLNYDQVASFPALRFILIVSPDQPSEAQFSRMLTGFEDSGITLLYQISRPG